MVWFLFLITMGFETTTGILTFKTGFQPLHGVILSSSPRQTIESIGSWEHSLKKSFWIW